MNDKEVQVGAFLGNYLVNVIESGTRESFETEVKEFLNKSIGDHRLVDVKYTTYTNENGHLIYSALVIYEGRS